MNNVFIIQFYKLQIIDCRIIFILVLIKINKDLKLFTIEIVLKKLTYERTAVTKHSRQAVTTRKHQGL